MEKIFRLNDEDMHKPLTMEQMTQMFSQEDKDAVYAINQELHKEKYNAHLKKDWRKLVDKKWREEGIWDSHSSDTTEKDDSICNSMVIEEEKTMLNSVENELNELYKQYGQNNFDLERLQHEQEAIWQRIKELREQKQ